MPISTYTHAAGDAVRNIGDFASNLVTPTVRLGVTGLARSGKTVFITALVHNLIASGRLPFFDAAAQGRLLRAYLEPQPDEIVPRFEYEKHLADLTGDALLDAWIFAGDDTLVTDVWSAGRHVVTDGRHVKRQVIEARYRGRTKDIRGAL